MGRNIYEKISKTLSSKKVRKFVIMLNNLLQKGQFKKQQKQLVI